jgi:uncharacterized coiled-coil protein SlyX
MTHLPIEMLGSKEALQILRDIERLDHGIEELERQKAAKEQQLKQLQRQIYYHRLITARLSLEPVNYGKFSRRNSDKIQTLLNPFAEAIVFVCSVTTHGATMIA